MELVEPVQMKLYESNTYRKDLSWLHFDEKPRVQDWQQVNTLIDAFQIYMYIENDLNSLKIKHCNCLKC